MLRQFLCKNKEEQICPKYFAVAQTETFCFAGHTTVGLCKILACYKRLLPSLPPDPSPPFLFFPIVKGKFLQFHLTLDEHHLLLAATHAQQAVSSFRILSGKHTAFPYHLGSVKFLGKFRF